MLRGKRCRLTQSHFEDLVCSLFESDASVAGFTANREFYRSFFAVVVKYKQDSTIVQTYKRFKRTLIYYDTDTQSAKLLG